MAVVFIFKLIFSLILLKSINAIVINIIFHIKMLIVMHVICKILENTENHTHTHTEIFIMIPGHRDDHSLVYYFSILFNKCSLNSNKFFLLQTMRINSISTCLTPYPQKKREGNSLHPRI